MKFSKHFIAAGEAMCDLHNYVPSPYLRKSFVLKAQPERAEITVSALGFYELWINGNRITKGLLSPYISNSDDKVYYDYYDLTPFLTAGENVIGLQLGNGMQNCFGGYVWDFHTAPFRSAPKTALYFEAVCDGECVTFEADSSFVCADSPLYYDDLRTGERYDANAEIPGWNLPGFDDSAWKPAIEAVTPKGEARLCEVHPILPLEERRPVCIWKEGDDYIYDFGINAAGLTRLQIKGEKGQKVDLVHAEYIKNGKFYYDNIRFPWPQYADYPLYLQQDVYTCRGEGVETYMPQFTYHGFRYVRVRGITPEQATPDLLTYVIMNTQMNTRGGFSCSDRVVNALQQMTRVSTAANFFHFPTDCPHREKNGWTADAALSSEQCLLNFEPDDNYVEWMRNIVSAQLEDGKLPGIIPTGGWGFHWGNGPAWDSVLVEIPYRLYILRGDLRAAQECADAIRLYVDYIISRRNEDGTIAIGLGDWCAPHDPLKSPLVFTDTVECVDICRKAAVLLRAVGRHSDADFAQKTSDAFRTAARGHLCDLSTMTFAGNCQTSQAMALYYGLCDNAEEEAKALSVLVNLIHENNDHIDCGVLGARVFFRTLADHGELDLAMKVLTVPTAPSYGEWVERGETSLAEDFWPADGNVQSRNHHFFGDISAFFIEYLAGIRVDMTAKEQITVSPYFPTEMQCARGYHVSPVGRIDVNWYREDAKITLELTLPAGVTAPVTLHDGWHTEDGKTSFVSGSAKIVIVRD